VRIEGKVARFAQMDVHGHGAVGDDLRFVNREARHRIDDFVARAVIGDRGDRVGDEGLRAGADDDLFRRDVESTPLSHVARSRRAQFVDPGRRRVAVLARANRRDRGVLDVYRRRKIRLANAERDDVASRAHEVVHLGEHDEGVLGAEALAAAAHPGHDVRCVHLGFLVVSA
jgi:hypothetical protein